MVLDEIALADLDEPAVRRADGEALPLFRTTSTPRPPVKRRTSSAKSNVRESITRGTSRERSRALFSSLPAVARTIPPVCCANWTAARPTPPAAA
jgi:hypothetical protein